MCVVDHGHISVLGTPAQLKERLLGRFVLLDASDRPQLLRELQALGLTAADDPSGLVRVAYDGATAQQVIGSIRTPLTTLRIHEPSLEEAYVALLRDPQEAIA